MVTQRIDYIFITITRVMKWFFGVMLMIFSKKIYFRFLNLKFSDFQVESTGFLGLRARPTLRSNRPGELAVTREARLSRSQARLSFFENLRIKKHSQLSDRSATSGVPLVGRVAQSLGLSKMQHFRVGLAHDPYTPWESGRAASNPSNCDYINRYKPDYYMGL